MSSSKVQMNKLLPVMLSFVIMGFVDIIGTATNHIQQDFQLNDFIVQFLPMMVLLWFFILGVPAGVIQDKIGKRNMLNIGICTLLLRNDVCLFYPPWYWKYDYPGFSKSVIAGCFPFRQTGQLYEYFTVCKSNNLDSWTNYCYFHGHTIWRLETGIRRLWDHLTVGRIMALDDTYCRIKTRT